ncbi:Conserved_hypothetical protein [Hexamita inflata]|uniref:Serine aminopeptidase S33 domain-containing protein n=1 Tax=Hexamita inflata TaxID=28002 RepID=A0AA86R594_9EUKA|nr:Conserved hypothetical protein [Hexamita inflata]
MKLVISIALMAVVCILYVHKQQKIMYYSQNTKIVTAIKKLRYTNKQANKKVDKIQYSRVKLTHQEDEFDYFYYDYISGSDSSKPTVVILPFLGGHSQSNLIRSVVKRFNDQGHSVAVLLQRGSMGTSNHPNQQKFRQVSDYEDLQLLLSTLNREVILIGYSVGAYQMIRFLGKASNIKVHSAFACYFLWDQSHPFKVGHKADIFGSSIVQHVSSNFIYLQNHGISPESLQKVIDEKSMVVYDSILSSKLNMSKTNMYQERNDEIKQCLQNIKCECLFVWGKKDVLTPGVPVDYIKGNEKLSYAAVNCGHLDGIANELIYKVALK